MSRLVWIAIIVATIAGASCLGLSTYNSVVRYAETIRTMREVK